MKNLYLVCIALLIAATSFAQKKEKIKGSKTVTVTQKQVESFDGLEIEDNIEVFLIKGSSPAIEIEADDNLHDIINYEMTGSTLRITTTKNVTGHKRLSMRVTYTDNLTKVIARHEVILNALMDLELENITVSNFDYSKSFLNVKSANFSLVMNDKSKAEINLKAENTTLELNKNADLKALISSPQVKIDMYQKSDATIEGDADKVMLRLDNNASLTAKKFTAKNIDLLAESYSKCSVMAAEAIIIAATGKAEIQLLGSPIIEMKNFADNAVLSKKIQ